MSNITFRPGTSADARAIAQLHITSWKRSYRGILSDAFLDGAVSQDRMSMWTSRLAEEPDDTIYIQLAEQAQQLVGFVCLIRNVDEQWGALIDNLHVLSEVQGHGLGRRLMRDAALWLTQRDPTSDMYLWVYKENRKARTFYEKIGGVSVEERREEQPDGFEADIVRYHWASPIFVK